METIKHNENTLYSLTPTNKKLKVQGNNFKTGRMLIGRAESCEMRINSMTVSSVHAVFEIFKDKAKIYDMNSRNGTFLNGKKVVSEDVKEGDKLIIGECEFIFEKYSKTPGFLPLDTLDPKEGSAAPLQGLPAIPSIVDKEKQAERDVPYIVYPLSKDPKADFSEYIFEDSDELHPIFKYEYQKESVEVIILFQDSVYSVDYIPDKDGTYRIVGSAPKSKEIEFSYLGKKEKVDFIQVNKGQVVVNPLHNYKMSLLTSSGLSEDLRDPIQLIEEDILKLKNGDLEMYVRKVSAPPSVKTPPFFRLDQDFKKYFTIIMLVLAALFATTFLYEVPEKEKENDPERIARILYTKPLKLARNKTVESTPKKKKVKQKSPKKVVKKQPQKPKPKPKKVEKAKPKVATSSGSKTAKRVQKVKKVNKPLPKAQRPKPAPRAATKSAATRANTARTRKANRPSPNKGTVDAYKSIDFKSTISSIAAKGGSLRGATSATKAASGSKANIGGGVASNVKKASVNSAVGSLSGSASGKLAESKGTEGLATNKGTYVAGIPSKTVVLGSMDPDVIRRILREHLPQFRYCYQKELDRNASKNMSGVIQLVFSIGASGHVSKAGVEGSSLPGSVRSCVAGVLRGIKFPSPLGGGTVDVKQPFNFYPKTI